MKFNCALYSYQIFSFFFQVSVMLSLSVTNDVCYHIPQKMDTSSNVCISVSKGFSINRFSIPLVKIVLLLNLINLEILKLLINSLKMFKILYAVSSFHNYWHPLKSLVKKKVQPLLQIKLHTEKKILIKKLLF